MVWKPTVDLMGIHIGFGHIRSLEGSIGILIWILWRFYLFLTTRSLCSLTCPPFVQLSTELFFASYSTGFKLHFESVYRIFPTKIKKTAQEQPSPFGQIRLSVDPFIPFINLDRFGCPWIPVFPSKIRADSAVRRSLSVDPYILRWVRITGPRKSNKYLNLAPLYFAFLFSK